MPDIQIFLSTPKAYLKRQELFLSDVERILQQHGLVPVTLGRNEYDIDAPLRAIRRLMNGSCGLLCIGLRRTHIYSGVDRPESDTGETETDRSGTWLTSAYSQIEPAMAYQIGLPVLLWREKGVRDDGVFDRGVCGLSMPEFDLDFPPILKSPEWEKPLLYWIDRVRSVYKNRGEPKEQW